MHKKCLSFFGLFSGKSKKKKGRPNRKAKMNKSYNNLMDDLQYSSDEDRFDGNIFEICYPQIFCSFFWNEELIFQKIWYFVTKIVLTYCEKNCSSDREKLLKFEAEDREFAKVLRSLKTINSNNERSEQLLKQNAFRTCC